MGFDYRPVEEELTLLSNVAKTQFNPLRSSRPLQNNERLFPWSFTE